MTRLIDADALIVEWYRINDIDENDRGARFVGYTEIARLIDHAPTVDAFEVVRCKECKFAQNNRYNSRVDGKCSVLCEHVTTEDGRYELKVFRNANDYCSFGERKDESEVEK